MLERKHSWSAGDLERYMSLIRSEHINDQAIRQAKDSVISAEAALEEARTQLEKRERAQYHEEQIWSDTIRRNSTWVTFVLMGVNIFLLLLSLAILEPWRRRRMVREIKSALEAQKVAIEAVPAAAAATIPASTAQELAAIEEEIDRAFEPSQPIREAAIPDTDNDGLAVEDAGQSVVEDLTPTLAPPPENVADSVQDSTNADAPPPVPTLREDSPAATKIVEDTLASNKPRSRFASWRSNIASEAQDIISDRVISMRRIDYTTAILQGAAAGAVITGAIIAMLRPS